MSEGHNSRLERAREDFLSAARVYCVSSLNHTGTTAEATRQMHRAYSHLIKTERAVENG